MGVVGPRGVEGMVDRAKSRDEVVFVGLDCAFCFVSAMDSSEC